MNEDGRQREGGKSLKGPDAGMGKQRSLMGEKEIAAAGGKPGANGRDHRGRAPHSASHGIPVQAELPPQVMEPRFPARRSTKADTHPLSHLPRNSDCCQGVMQHMLVYREDSPAHGFELVAAALIFAGIFVVVFAVEFHTDLASGIGQIYAI